MLTKKWKCDGCDKVEETDPKQGAMPSGWFPFRYGAGRIEHVSGVLHLCGVRCLELAFDGLRNRINDYESKAHRGRHLADGDGDGE